MKLSLVLLALGCMFQLTAQDTLSLKECFDRAEKCRYSGFIENSNRSVAAINLQFHKYTALPSLNAFSNLSASFGRSLDQITNTFRYAQVNSQSYGINSSLTLFNGLEYFNKRDDLRLIKNQSEEQLNLQLNQLYDKIASLYVELCIQRTQIELSNQRIEHLRNLLSIQQDLFKAGNITYVDTLKAVNTVLKEESQLVILQQNERSSQMKMNVLIGEDLNELHFFDANKILEAEGLLVNEEEFSLKFNAIDLKLVDIERKMTRTLMLPSLTINGAVGTGYSAALKTDPFDPSSRTIRYGSQLSENLFQSVSIQLSVPLFNKGEQFRKAQIRKIKENELLIQADYLKLELARKKLENDQAIKTKKVIVQNLERSIFNLHEIYNASVELYTLGEIRLTELEELFVQWQTEIVNWETSKYELAKFKLIK